MLLTACGQGSNTPSGYGIVTQSNFLKGCLSSYGVDVEGAFDVTATTDLVIPEGATAVQTGYCNCVYGGLSSPVLGDDGEPVETAEGDLKTELPFDDFKQINADLKSNVGADDSSDTTGTTEAGGDDGVSTSTDDLIADFEAALGDDVSEGARTTTAEVLSGCVETG